MGKMGEAVEMLSLAYYFSKNEKYAECSAYLIRAWFLMSETKMYTNVNFDRAVKGVNERHKEGVLETRGLANVIDAIGLLQGSKAWTATDQKNIHA